MNSLIFIWPGNDPLADQIAEINNLRKGNYVWHKFPDGETYIRIESNVREKLVFVFAPLDHPDEKIMGLTLLCRALKEHGAAHICLISPYLPYMRQDSEFLPGEVVSAEVFAGMICAIADSLVTVDPHLHRISSTNGIYSIPVKILHATEPISGFIHDHIQKPLIIGPDAESRQWAEAIADRLNAPLLILEKERISDHQVKIQLPEIRQYPDHTPVLTDDIISTAHTLALAVEHIRQLTTVAPVCLAVHALFTENAEALLNSAGAGMVATCNSILHPTNRIDISGLFADLGIPS